LATVRQQVGGFATTRTASEHPQPAYVCARPKRPCGHCRYSSGGCTSRRSREKMATVRGGDPWSVAPSRTARLCAESTTAHPRT
jgi:hypothetical protein